MKLLQTTTDPLANSTLGDYRKIAVNIRPASNRRQWGTAGEVNYDVADGLQLKSLTAYRANRLTQVGDTDGTALNGRRTDQFEDQHQFSQEVNLTGKAGALTYILGAYYFNEHILVDSSVTTYATNVRANFNPTINTDAIAGFAQGSFAVTEQITLTAGIRYTSEKKKFDQIATNFSLVTGPPECDLSAHLQHAKHVQGLDSEIRHRTPADRRPPDLRIGDQGFQIGRFQLLQRQCGPGLRSRNALELRSWRQARSARSAVATERDGLPLRL